MRSLLIFLGLLLLGSCIEPFEPEINSDERVLVVDGILSNDDVSAVIELSRSYPYDQNRTNYETGALIVVESSDGQSWQLTEKSDGVYISEMTINPEIGLYYRLRIVTSDGEEYLSDFQEYLVANQLDDVFYKEYRNNIEGSVLGKEGVEIYINAHGDNTTSRYYRWEWEEDWEIRSPLNYPSPKTCWQNSESAGININTTDNLDENKLDNQYLKTITFNTNRLAIRYRIRIKQYSVTRDNYIYFQKLLKINEGSGGFFDPIPAGLTGNIECISNPDTPVLGFFEASEVIKSEVYINRYDLKNGYIASGFEDCEILTIPDSIYNTGEMKEYYYVYEYFDSTIPDTLVVMVNLRKCYSCGFVGETEHPEGWIND